MPSLGLALGLPFNPAASGGGFAGAADSLSSAIVEAYSVRRLLASYAGSSGRIRETSGSTEADIGFTTAGDLNLTALTTHLNGASGAWRKFYGQKGLYDLGNTTAAQQPAWNAGGHAKGMLDFDGSNDALTTASFNVAQPFYIFMVTCTDSTAALRYMCGSLHATWGGCYINSGGGVGAYWGASLAHSVPISAGAFAAEGVLVNGAAGAVDKNGSRETMNLGTRNLNSGFILGNRQDLSLPYDGKFSEVIIFNQDPTGLPGWAAFFTSVRSYFGTP